MGFGHAVESVRLLTAANVPSLCELSGAAGWNQTPEDWLRMITLEPLGCFGIEQDRRIVATTTLLTYGKDLAWVGMVLTSADYQRRGYARQLVTTALELADTRGIRSVKLDATDQGRPLYSSLDFKDEQPIERWLRSPAPLASARANKGEIPYDLDRRATGADRSAFLKALGPAMVANNAFLQHRPGARANHLGPCIGTCFEDASQLIRAALATKPDEPWLWDILPARENARALAQELGFTPVRNLTRMYRGENVRGDESMVYAIAGFEAG
jgi:Acetyltransferase (GNAT) family/Acetyltransferase (GNAT) domain